MSCHYDLAEVLAQVGKQTVLGLIKEQLNG